MIYEAELRPTYTDGPSALANLAGLIYPVTIDGGSRVGQARRFRLSRDGRLVCTIDTDETAWEEFRAASQEGSTLFVHDYPVIGPFSSPVEVVNG